jgi:hypothetical protein
MWHVWGRRQVKGKGKAIPLQFSRRLRLPEFKTISTCRWQCCQPYAPAAFIPENISGTHFCYWLSRFQGHGAAGRIMSKNPMTPSGIDPATFHFVAQCLNHCATACPRRQVHADFVGNLKETDNLEDIVVVGDILLKWILNRMGLWTESVRLETGTSGGLL